MDGFFDRFKKSEPTKKSVPEISTANIDPQPEEFEISDSVYKSLQYSSISIDSLKDYELSQKIKTVLRERGMIEVHIVYPNNIGRAGKATLQLKGIMVSIKKS